MQRGVRLSNGGLPGAEQHKHLSSRLCLQDLLHCGPPKQCCREAQAPGTRASPHLMANAILLRRPLLSLHAPAGHIRAAACSAVCCHRLRGAAPATRDGCTQACRAQRP